MSSYSQGRRETAKEKAALLTRFLNSPVYDELLQMDLECESLVTYTEKRAKIDEIKGKIAEAGFNPVPIDPTDPNAESEVDIIYYHLFACKYEGGGSRAW